MVALEVQKLIRRKELAPISSHPNMSVNQELAHTSNIIDNLNTCKYIKKFKMFFSNLMYEKA